MRILIIASLLLMSTICVAADRNSKIQALVEAQGLLGMFEQQIAQAKQQARNQANQVFDQILSGPKKPPPEVVSRLKKAADDFVAAVATPWTAQEIVDAWATSYGAQFSDEELEQLTVFYTSPLGRKDVRVSQEAMQNITQSFAERFKPIFDKASKKYASDLQQIVQ
jgi:hypothetical protein